MAVVGMLAAVPASATGNNGGGRGLFCGKPDMNGCSVSPVSLKSCLKDLRGDIRELNCDIFELIHDVYVDGRTHKFDVVDFVKDLGEIFEDLAEIGYDKAVIRSLLK